jgi:phage minor structural protein
VTEERNGGFELELQYPVTGLHYGDIAMRALLLVDPNPYAQAQYFRVYKISRPINGVVTVNAAHISYDLSGVPVSAFKAGTAADALTGLAAHAAVACHYTFWTDLSTAAEFAVPAPMSLRKALGGTDGSVLGVFGGEYEWDNTTVKLHAHRGTDRGVTIRYGKNLTDVTQEENCANVYTGVYPYWADSDGNITELPEKIVNAPGQYNFVKILPLDLSSDFAEQPTAAALRDAAKNYVKSNNIGVPIVNLRLSYTQLEQTVEYAGTANLERVSLCDTVRVEFERLGVDATAKVIKCTYNTLLERYDRVELGDAKSSLADTIAGQGQSTLEQISTAKSDLQKAIDRATQLITGNLGGYVILHSSTGAQTPDEILVMDTPDIATAKRVWRCNLSGCGYSSQGYSGPYRLAATMDGAINADFITTGKLSADLIKAGTLNADLIKAGTLADTAGGTFFSFDLASGKVYINGVFECLDNAKTAKLRVANGRVQVLDLSSGTEKLSVDIYRGTAGGGNIDLYSHTTGERTISLEGGAGYGYVRALKIWDDAGGEKNLQFDDDGIVRWY